MRDVHTALARELCRLLPGLTLQSSRSEPWASITFTGARHAFVFVPGIAPPDLSDAEFSLTGHLVADIKAERSGETVLVEALTIEAD